MPDIDVSDVVLDSLVAGEAFTVIERLETVNGFGESTVRASSSQQYGSVQPGTPNSLVREAAFDLGQKTIRVVTPYRLRSANRTPGVSLTSKPSIVLWKGDYYEVSSLNDWSSHGVGMVEADCVSIDYVPTAPAQLPTQPGYLDFTLPQSAAYAGVVTCL